jgi:hypothetical protein
MVMMTLRALHSGEASDTSPLRLEYRRLERHFQWWVKFKPERHVAVSRRQRISSDLRPRSRRMESFEHVRRWKNRGLLRTLVLVHWSSLTAREDLGPDLEGNV